MSSWPTSDSDAYFIDYTKCKLKNVINIKKTTSMGMFLKKLGVKQYNYNSKTHTLDFICGKCYCISNVDDDDDAEYEDVWWTIKMNNKNLEEIAKRCTDIFIKTNLRHIKLNIIEDKKRQYTEYYTNSEMSEQEYNNKLAVLNKKIAKINATYNKEFR